MIFQAVVVVDLVLTWEVLKGVKYNLEIIVFENGTQQWIQKSTGTHQRKHVIALRWCRDSIHYDWLKPINSDEPERVTPLPVSQKLGPKFTDANNSPLPTSQESTRSRQLKNKSL